MSRFVRWVPVVALFCALVAPAKHTFGQEYSPTPTLPSVPAFQSNPVVVPSALQPNQQVQNVIEQAALAGSSAQIATQRAQEALAKAKACGAPNLPKCRSLWKQAEQAVGQAIVLQKYAKELRKRAQQLISRLHAKNGVPSLGFGGTYQDPIAARLPGGGFNQVITGVLEITAGQKPSALPRTGGAPQPIQPDIPVVIGISLFLLGFTLRRWTTSF